VQYSFSQTFYISSMKLQVHVLLEYSRYSKVIHILAETSFDRYATISPFIRTSGICEKCRAGRALTSAERSPVSQRRRGYRGENSDRKLFVTRSMAACRPQNAKSCFPQPSGSIVISCSCKVIKLLARILHFVPFRARPCLAH
jgi:hypothetical protein